MSCNSSHYVLTRFSISLSCNNKKQTSRIFDLDAV